VAHTRDGLPGAKSFLESLNAKFAFYGPQQAPTRIQVQLVQLHQDVSQGVTTKLATAFWQSISKAWGYSPLEQGDYRLRKKYMKVLKTVLIDMESTEDHVNARMKQLYFNSQLNRVCYYKWGYNTDTVDLDGSDLFENTYSSEDVSCFVHPSARVYILIKALTQYPSVPAN
jgi:hypothetical protein